MVDKKQRILIVDDEHNTREAMARFLKLRFDVETAADGEAAIDCSATIITTCADRSAHAQRRRNERPRSHPEQGRPASLHPSDRLRLNQRRRRRRKKGAFDFVAKPVKLDKLESVIDAALASRKKNISPSNPAEPASEPAVVPIRPVSPEGEPLVLPPRAAATPWHGSSLSQRPSPLPAPLC